MQHFFYVNLREHLFVHHFEKLAELLRARGYKVEVHNDRICFQPFGGGVPKEIHFKMIVRSVQGGLLERHKPWATYTNPEWSLDNGLVVFITHKDKCVFVKQDYAAVRVDVLAALKVNMDEIATAYRSICFETDSPEMIRRFLGYDFDNAVKAWTRPNPDDSDQEARLFKCWKCDKLGEHTMFNLLYDGVGMSPFQILLSRYALQSDLPWCTACDETHSILDWTEADAARLRVDVVLNATQKRILSKAIPGKILLVYRTDSGQGCSFLARYLKKRRGWQRNHGCASPWYIMDKLRDGRNTIIDVPKPYSADPAAIKILFETIAAYPTKRCVVVMCHGVPPHLPNSIRLDITTK
jgi:hypothetical protein